MPLPLLFFIELLILILLVVAAAGPFYRNSDSAPMIVVLDDSFSMQAGAQNDTPRIRAEEALIKLFDAQPNRPISLILAGDMVKTTGSPCQSVSELKYQLKQWNCNSTEAKMSEAVSLARKLSPESTSLLVLSDHEPTQLSKETHCLSFGKNLPNLAFVHAARTPYEGGDKCFIQIANLSDKPVKTKLNLTFPDLPKQNSTRALSFLPNEIKKLTIPIKFQKAAAIMTLAPDAVEQDNTVYLAPVSPRPVRVKIDIGYKKLSSIIRKAVIGTGMAEEGEDNIDLTIADFDPGTKDDSWHFFMLKPARSKAFRGPYIADMTHPLMNGLQLSSAIWSGGDISDQPGLPLLTSGNTQLIQVVKGKDSRTVYCSFDPNASSLQETPNWPILFYNLLKWRQNNLPGVRLNNLKCGQEVNFKPPVGIKKVQVKDPDGVVEQRLVHSGRVAILLQKPGFYGINDSSGKLDYLLGSSNLSAGESDLSQMSTGESGASVENPANNSGFSSLIWVFLIGVLLLLLTHLYLIKGGQQ